MSAYQTVGFIGAGQMASALAGGMIKAGIVEAANVTAFDPDAAACERFQRSQAGSQIAVDSTELAARCEVIILAVKPHIVLPASRTLAAEIGSGHLLISIAAGVPLSDLCETLGSKRVIRVMPNTPCLIGEGASAFCRGEAVSDADADWTNRLLNSVGVGREVSESLLNAVTGLSGSGPAFVYTMIEALSDGGVRAGLPRELAIQLAAQTVRGAASMVLQCDAHSAELKDRVASPGGTTIAGLQRLEEGGVRSALMNAVVAAADRADELSERS